MFGWATPKRKDNNSSTCTVLPLRILSHNIRFAKFPPSEGEKPWEERRQGIANELRYHTRFAQSHVSPSNHGDLKTYPSASFICLQEVLHSQLLDILVDLNGQPSQGSDAPSSQDSYWAYIGVGRDDGKTQGEYSPIIYPRHVFDLLHYETVWLSPTPDRPSKGWDAGNIRILTVGVFKHKISGLCFIACNTHLDNAGSRSRRESVQIILDTIKKLRHQWKGPDSKPSKPAVFLAGDFNSFPTQEAYLAMKASDFMVDIHDYVPPDNRYGDNITFTGFKPDEERDDRGRIDFIWLGPKDHVCAAKAFPVETERRSSVSSSISWYVDGYSVIPNVFENGVYCSDHRCVVGDLRLI